MVQRHCIHTNLYALLQVLWPERLAYSLFLIQCFLYLLFPGESYEHLLGLFFGEEFVSLLCAVGIVGCLHLHQLVVLFGDLILVFCLQNLLSLVLSLVWGLDLCFLVLIVCGLVGNMR